MEDLALIVSKQIKSNVLKIRDFWFVCPLYRGSWPFPGFAALA